MTKFETTIFEPHSMFGETDPDGEIFPFGYISTTPAPMPIFELRTILEWDARDLRALALKMAAAAEMYAALDELLSANREGYRTVTGPREEEDAAINRVIAAEKIAEAVLRKAGKQ